MARVQIRARAETAALYLDFFYRGVRCREQTALKDTAENRKRLQALANRIQKEIAQGAFSYEAHFPNSPKAQQFSHQESGLPTSSSALAAPTNFAAPQTPTFSEFSETWRAEMSPQWRRLHRQGVDDIFSKHLLPAFGERALADIAKSDVLAFRAGLAKLPGRGGKTLSAGRINKIMAILRQLLTESSERFGVVDAFRGIKRLKAKKSEVHPFSMGEVERIRSTIRSDFRNYVTTRFFTGMRTGEINWTCPVQVELKKLGALQC